jgi:hypothetical protein
LAAALPLFFVAALRQVHFLATYWAERNGQEWQEDKIAQFWFPFISSPRFTLKELCRRPSIWFWFTKDIKDLDIAVLKD